MLRDGALCLLRIAGAGGGFALVTVDGRDGSTREVRWFAGGIERARVLFAQLGREPNGALFPRRVLFWRVSPRVAATIVVDSRRLGPSLPEATFAPPL
jgi:hypothetical protein